MIHCLVLYAMPSLPNIKWPLNGVFFTYISIYGLYDFLDDTMELQVNQNSFPKNMVVDGTPHLTRPIIGTCLIDKIQLHFMVIVNRTQFLWKGSVLMTIHVKWKMPSMIIFSHIVFFSVQYHLDYTTSTLCDMPFCNHLPLFDISSC